MSNTFRPPGPPSLSDYLTGPSDDRLPIGVPEGYVADRSAQLRSLQDDRSAQLRSLQDDRSAQLRSLRDADRAMVRRAYDQAVQDRRRRGLAGPPAMPAPPTMQRPAPAEWLVPPRYFAGDEYKPASLSVESRAAIQRAMASAGVLTGKFRMGIWDPPTVDAYKRLLAFANASGLTWQQALNEWASAEEVDDDEGSRFIRGRYVPGEFVQDAFLPEDTDTLTQRIKAQFRQVLGRDPNEGEIGRYVAQLRDVEREAYEQNVAAARAEFRAQEAARRRHFEASEDERLRQFGLAGGNTGGATAQGRGAPIPQPGTFQKADPVASFVERWERDYANEINRNRRVAQGAANRMSFMDTIRSLDSAIGA